MGAPAFIAIFALAASAVAGPLDRSGPCARQCTESAKFTYSPGTSYFFNYESDAVTSMQGTTQEESRLHLKTQVEIHAVSKCDFIMRLSGTTLSSSDARNPRSRHPVSEQESFRQSLERNTLRFSFQDGRVDSLCPSETETAQVLNVKRGILSVLQTTADSLENPEKVIESDVAGKCTVNYEPLGRGWNSVTVRKTKDMTSCSERQNTQSSIQINPFAEDKATKSMPLVKGNQDCQQVFKHNRLESVFCSETHVFRPFSRQEGGAMTKVTQALTFSNEKKNAFTLTDYSNIRLAMTYDHNSEGEDHSRLTRQVELIFVDLCMAAREDIRPSVPGKFTSFVYGLRHLEHTDLVNMYRRVDSICAGNTKAKKMYLDGVSMAGTSGSVKFIVDLMQHGEMTESDIDLWMTTLAFVNKPDKDTVAALLPLLDGQRQSALLPVSAVIHTYCKTNPDCGMKEEVRSAVRKIVTILGNGCNGDKTKVMLALKAVGNMGVSSEAEQKLESCVQNKALDPEVRVAAVQAYRRFNCDVMRSPVMDLYTNPEESVEVRIAAFLSGMRCPSREVIMRVKDTMENEKSKQVGSFVMSYLKNIQKQSSLKNDIHEIVSNIGYMNKYESDIRKFSRNFQNSFFLEALDSGLSVDSNLIFDSSSYLPRRAMLNLTVDMMGNSVNVFELEGRAEGLEKLVESMFGPEGYFRKETPKSSIRPKKSIFDYKVEGMSKRYDVKKRFEKEPSLSLDLKIFGNSLWYKKLQNGNMASEAFNVMDVMVELAKEQEMEFTKSFLFLDTTLIIPTGSGFPLKLAINGSAVMDLKMSGKVDAKSLQNVDVHGKIQPSGAIEIATVMSVETGVAKTGLKMVATLHSSTLLDGLVEIRGGKIFQARLNVPKNQMEIIDVKSRIFLVSGEKEREQKGTVEQSSLFSQCSGALTKTPLGVEVCGELQLPSMGKSNTPLYPFSGPAAFRIFLRKTDESMTHYNVEVKWTEDKTGRVVTGQHLVMSFNTPQSKVDREISAEFHLDKSEETVAIKFKIPNKKVALTGKRVMNQSEKRLSMAVSVDDKEKFSLTTALTTEQTEGGIHYQPSLEVRGPSTRLLNLRGFASLKHGQKYSGEVTVEDLTATPVIIKGDVSVSDRDRYEALFNVESYAITAKVQGHAQFRRGFSSKMTVQYKVMDGRNEKLDITGKYRDLSANGLAKYTGAISVTSTALPEYSTTVSWDTQITTGHLENTLEFSFGDGRIRRIQKISVSEILRYEGSLENNKVDATFRMTYPEKDIDYALTISHQNTLETLVNAMNLKYVPGKELSSNVDIKLTTRPLELNSDITVKYPGREMKLQMKVNPMESQEYQAAVTAQWQRGKQARVVGTFRDRSTRAGKDYHGTIDITMPNTRPMSLTSQLTTIPGRYVISVDGELGRGSYGAKGEYTTTSMWNHRVSVLFKAPKVTYNAEASLQKERERVSGKFDVNVPEYRRLTGAVEANNGAKVKSGSIDILWDADRDSSRRVALDGEFRQTADGHQGKFNYKCPCKVLSGSYNTNYQGQYNSGLMRGNVHAELEWEDNNKVVMDIGGNSALKSSRRQLNGDVKMTTPFTGWENMALSVQHTDTWPEWNNKVTVVWSKNKKIILGTEGKIRTDSYSRYLDTSMKINTPFRNYESLSLREVFEQRPSDISSSSLLQWGTGKTMELSLSGALVGSNGLRAGMNFTSPFDTLRDLSMSFSNSYSKNAIDTDAEVRWNARNSVSMNFDGRNTMGGKKHTCSAEIQFLSSFRNYEKMNTKIVYNNDGRAASVNSDMRWSNNKVTVEMTGNNRNTYYGYDMEGKLQYSSSFKNFENGEIKIAHVNDAQKFSTNVESRLPYSHNINVKILGNMLSAREMDSSLALTSSMTEDVSYEIAYKVDGNRFVANGVATYGTQKFSGDVLGNLNYGHRSWDVDYKVNINTPFKGLEGLKLTIAQNRRELQFITRVQFSRNQNTISLNHDLKIEDALNFVNNMKLTTPYRNMRNIEININQNSKRDLYKHNTEVQWGSKKALVSSEFSVLKAVRGRSFEAKLNAKSPFQLLSNLDIFIKHEDDTRTYRPQFSVQWNEENKVNFDGVLSNDRFQRVDVRLTAGSSFNGYETMVYTGNYDISKPQKTIEMSYRWNVRTNQAVTFKGVLEISNRNGMIDAIVTCPMRGFETMQMKMDYNFIESDYSVNIFTQYGVNRITYNGKVVPNKNGCEVNTQLTTPFYGYEKLSAFGTYTINKNDMYTEASFEWGIDKKVVVTAEYRARNGKLVTKANVNTPFLGYRKLALKLEGDVKSPRKVFNGLFQWEPSKVIQTDVSFESDFSRFGNLNVIFRSPFEAFKELSMNGQFKRISGEFNADATLQWIPSKQVTGAILLKSTEIQITIDTPFRPYKNIKITSNIINRNNEKRFISSLEWDNMNKADFTANIKSSDNMLEAAIEVATPYNGMKTFSVNGRFMNDNFKMMEGRVNIITPFESAKRFQADGLIRNNRETRDIAITVSGPTAKISLNGNLRNNEYRDVEGKMNIESNVKYIPSFNVQVSYKNNDWKLVEATVGLNDVHSTSMSFKNEDQVYNVEATVESPKISISRVTVSLNLNIKDIRNLEGKFIVETPAQRHIVTMSEKITKRGFESEIKANSPMIRGEEVLMNLFYINKKNQNIKGKISLTFLGEPHVAELNFNNENRDMITSINIQCRMVPSGRLNLEGKVSKPSENAVETTFTLLTGSTRHSLIANGKILENQAEVNVNLDSPWLKSRTASLTASLNNDYYRNIEGSISLKCLGGESRVAFNMKRNGWRDMDAFFTLNLPIEMLSMVRVDMKMQNEGLKSMEGSLDIQTSLESMRRMSMSGKMKNTDSAWDMSANFKLPVRRIETISLLCTIHKNRELSRFSPRITLSLPNNKYVAYATYEKNDDDLQSNIGVELDSKKTELSLNMRSNEYRLILLTPVRGYERYSTVVNFSNEKGKRTGQIVFEDAANQKSTMEGFINFNNLFNFNGELQIRTPFVKLRDVSTKLRQQFRRGRWVMVFEHNMDKYNKLALNIDHTTSPIVGTIQFTTPSEKVQNIKIGYNLQTSQNSNGKLDIDLNSRSILRLVMDKTYQAETRLYNNNYQVELPSFPYTLSISNKPLPTGHELIIKSVMPTRRMNFQTIYQSSSSHFSHGSQFSWDESSGRTISYEIRNTLTSRQGTEFFARLNMPIRALELRTTNEKTGNGQTVSGDLLWDVARDPTKHMKVTVEHVDDSNRNTIAHKFRLAVAHPQLSKDIIASTECRLSSNEIYGKTEVEYSRYQQHNLFLEAHARNSAQSRRESRYIASLAARHPVTNLDIKVNAEVANTQEEMTAEIKMNYLDIDRRQMIQELRANILKVKQHIELMARSNERKINVLGRMFRRDNELTLALEQTVNDGTPVHSHFRWSHQHKNMELNISTLNGDRVHLSASMPDDHIRADLCHTSSGRQVDDVQIYLGLKEDKVLESKITWRPEMFMESQVYVSRTYKDQMPKMVSTVSTVQNTISSEWEAKSAMIGRSLTQETKLFVNDMSREMSNVRLDIQRASNDIYNMYRRDEFYMRTAYDSMGRLTNLLSKIVMASVDYLTKGFEMIGETVSMTVDVVSKMWSDMVDYVIRTSIKWRKNVVRSFVVLCKKMSQIKRDYLVILSEKALDMAMDLVDYAVNYLVVVAEKTQKMISRYAPAMNQYLQRVQIQMKSFLTWIEERYGAQLRTITEQPAYKSLSEYMERLMITVRQFQEQISYQQIIKSTRMFMGNSVENAASAYTYIRDHPNINYVNDVAAQAFQQGRQLLKDLGMNTVVVNILEELYQKTQQLAWSTLRDLTEEYGNFRGNLHYTFEPQNGKIEIEMRLPVVRNSLKELMDIDSYPQYLKLKELVDQISFNDFCVWDTYYKYKRYTDVNFWIPPFQAQALLAGNQHFMTFDNFDFDFAGECSYLLARDFVDGNFTVTVNFVRDNNRVVKKSLNIFTDGVKVEISRDNKVTVDDRKVELPQEIGETAITMEDGVIMISNGLGYKIKCNLVHDICTMEVSGFYFGKTGGLFGTNNYEPGLDMKTPDNKLAENLEDFADNWQVGSSQCTRGRNLAEVSAVDIKAQDKCERLFKNANSVFRSGFRQVQPEPFLRMCVTDLSVVREVEQMAKMCTSAAAYVERCRQEGVNLNMPKHCVRCQRLNADDMESGDVVKITRDEPVRAADVVFIVEEKHCNKNIPKTLRKMAQGLDDGFKKNGYRQVNFAVVGFGGDGIHSEAHVITSDSQVFGTFRNIDSALNSLTTGNGEGNIFMALRYAAKLPFMTGSTKTFVLAKCSACEVEEMKADYSEMLRTMLDGDITLHLVMDHEFETKSPAKMAIAKKVVGLDRKFAYTHKDLKDSVELRGDSDLLAQLKTPKDLCVPLALEVNGSFFSAARMLDSKGNLNKKTVEILSRRIVKTAEPADCQICECISTQSGIGKSVCQRCVSPVVAQMVSDDLSPMIYYGSESETSEPSGNAIESEETEDLAPAKPKVKTLQQRKNKRKN